MTYTKSIFLMSFGMLLLLAGSSNDVVYARSIDCPSASARDTSRTSSCSQKVDTIHVDTLREVVVEGSKQLPVMDQFNKDLQRNGQPSGRSLGDIIEKVAPGLQDKMLHPFAVKDRKKERKRKKVKKILEDYDKVDTSTDLFDEIVRKQREEDEKNGMTNWQHLQKTDSVASPTTK